jgi:signal transduction histidine kinase
MQAQKMEAVGQLACGIAQDLNNMITAALGNLSMLEERVKGAEDAEELVALPCSRPGSTGYAGPGSGNWRPDWRSGVRCHYARRDRRYNLISIAILSC